MASTSTMRPVDGRVRRLHPWPQHVRAGPQRCGRTDWKGWWGDNPPYHAPMFVLTHHARAPIEMEGGTIFHFVTEGIEAALDQAKAAAGEPDVKIGGGVSTVRQYLHAGLIDELHFACRRWCLGRGEAIFAGIDLPCTWLSRHRTSGDRALHPHRTGSIIAISFGQRQRAMDAGAGAQAMELPNRSLFLLSRLFLIDMRSAPEAHDE